MSIKYTLFDPNLGNIALATALAATASVGQTITTPTITGGTIDGTPIGGTTPAAVTATTLSASGAVSGAGVIALLATPTGPIGTGTPVQVAAAALSTTTKGTFICNGVTPVTVTDANVTANSTIIVTLKTVGGTVGAVPAVKTITPTTGFTIAGTASDTSTYNYAIIN